tara:strand:+ start:143 stop:736 length:594 start_codon:yes stop_codon:yes gene_type:complete
MQLPIFPLNGAILFPETSLPLNIFENRYLEMVNYSLARDRYIGMIQSDKNNNLYEVGCIGKIQSFNETNDGRYLISLKGVNCFRVIDEIENNFSFRMINAEIIKDEKENIKFKDQQKSELIDKYKSYIKIKELNFSLEEIEKVEFSQIIKFIAMVSPFTDIDKQALLETKNLFDFYDKLLSILELETIGEFPNNSIN